MSVLSRKIKEMSMLKRLNGILNFWNHYYEFCICFRKYDLLLKQSSTLPKLKIFLFKFIKYTALRVFMNRSRKAPNLNAYNNSCPSLIILFINNVSKDEICKWSFFVFGFTSWIWCKFNFFPILRERVVKNKRYS